MEFPSLEGKYQDLVLSKDYILLQRLLKARFSTVKSCDVPHKGQIAVWLALHQLNLVSWLKEPGTPPRAAYLPQASVFKRSQRLHSGVLLHLKAINFAENQPLEDGRKAVRQLGTLRAVGLRQLDMCWNGERVGRVNERGCCISGGDNEGRETPAWLARPLLSGCMG